MEVQNLPGDVMRGKDAQIDKALEWITMQLKGRPVMLPEPPPYPDKSRPHGS